MTYKTRQHTVCDRETFARALMDAIVAQCDDVDKGYGAEESMCGDFRDLSRLWPRSFEVTIGPIQYLLFVDIPKGDYHLAQGTRGYEHRIFIDPKPRV